jgi:solute carrier family 25 (mitochondrial folate transporter), member 32
MTLKSEGMRGLFRGYYISAFCTPFFHALYFPLYEMTKDFAKDQLLWHEGSFKLYAISASFSGMVCNIITNPFWVVRTRMQAEVFRSLSEDHYSSKYPTNMFKAMVRIQQNEGAMALYSGLSASFLGLMHPLLYFPLYEKSKIYFMENYEDKDRDSLSPKYVLISACSCKALTSLLTYPHEVIRSRQQDARRYEQQKSSGAGAEQDSS